MFPVMSEQDTNSGFHFTYQNLIKLEKNLKKEEEKKKRTRHPFQYYIKNSLEILAHYI